MFHLFAVVVTIAGKVKPVVHAFILEAGREGGTLYLRLVLPER